MRAQPTIGLAVGALLVFGAVSVTAQGPGDPHGQPGSGALVPGQAPAAPVVPDTATALLSLPEGAPAPTRVIVSPDTVMFGGMVEITLEPVAPDGAPPPDLSHDTDWLSAPEPEEPGRMARWLGRKAADPPPNTYRVFRTDPFRIRVAGAVSPVVHVGGRAQGTGQVAGLRSPPFPGFPWPRILGLVLLAAILILLIAWLWGRRHGPVAWPDRPVGTPAWPEAAVGLQKLLADGCLARGEGGRFLDGLAHLARRYTAGRFGLAAAEMTGREIIAAGRALGYPQGPVRALAGLIDEADRRRYDPEPPPPAWCREQAVGFYEQVQATRVLHRHSPVDPEILLAAEKAWASVARELDPTGRLGAEQNQGGAA